MSNQDTQHTPTPWTLQPIGDETECNVLGSGRELVGTLADHDAARIVACVNACEGFGGTDPAVAISGLRSRSDNVAGMCAEVDTLRARVALLERALREVAAARPDRLGCTQDALWEVMRDIARAALSVQS